MEINKKENIPFLSVYLKCVDKIEGKITEDEFNRFLDENIEVDNYISIQTKKSLIDIFFLVNDNGNDFSDLALIFEIFSVLCLLLTYSNIEISADEILDNNYDVVMKSGLYDYIINKCNNDFNKLYQMAINAISFKNSSIFSYLSDTINDNNNIKYLAKETQSIFNEFDENKLSIMKDILELNDPSMNRIKESIYSGVDLFIKDKKLQDLKEGK